MLCPIVGWAHENNQAQYDLYLYEDKTIVDAQFPWAMRNELIHFNPALDSAKSKNAFEETLFQYIQKNLILTGQSDTLSLTKIKVVPHSGHHEKYELTFVGPSPIKITNTILIRNKKHINHHNVFHKDFSFSFNLDSETTAHGWDLDDPPNNSFDYLALTQIIVALVTFLLIVFRQRIFPNAK